MKRVGLISSAAGFIFLGLWMIISQSNTDLSAYIFKFWPIIIIILGIEILTAFEKKQDGQKIKFNFLIIPVALIFLLISLYNNISFKIGDFLKFPSNNINFSLGLNNDLKTISSTKSLGSYGNKLSFYASNSDIRIEKSTDSNIKLDYSVYLERSSRMKSYDIPVNKSNDGYSIDINDGFIRGVKITIYIPENYGLDIRGNNLQLTSNSDISSSVINVDALNGNVDIGGNIPSSNISLTNGKVDFSNKLCRNVDIKLTNGVVNFQTEDKNLSVNLDIGIGPSEFNGEKRVNSGIIKSVGSGEGKLNINVRTGAINAKSQE